MSTISLPIDDLRTQITNCKRCEGYMDCSQPVPGFGYGNKLMIINGVTSKDDDFMDEPFSGRAGDYFKKLLRESGINFSDCYLTNVLKCATLKKKYLRTCKSWLHSEIFCMKPKAILYLGGVAMDSFKIDLANIHQIYLFEETPHTLLNKGYKRTEEFMKMLKEIKEYIYAN